jgi:hypothetical protein
VQLIKTPLVLQSNEWTNFFADCGRLTRTGLVGGEVPANNAVGSRSIGYDGHDHVENEHRQTDVHDTGETADPLSCSQLSDTGMSTSRKKRVQVHAAPRL